MTISRMRIAQTRPFGPTDLNFCLWGGVTDIINCADFFENRFRGSGAGRPWKMAFPIESVHRAYNSAELSRRHNDRVPDSYLMYAFVIENAYQAAASREPKSGSLYKSVST